MKVKTMHINNRWRYEEFPPPCRRCGEIIEVGEQYVPHTAPKRTKPYCMKCEEEMYI